MNNWVLKSKSMLHVIVMQLMACLLYMVVQTRTYGEQLSEREFDKLCEAEDGEEPQKAEPGVLRGRGRPRKYEVGAEHDLESKKPETSVQRGRGRPRKFEESKSEVLEETPQNNVSPTQRPS